MTATFREVRPRARGWSAVASFRLTLAAVFALDALTALVVLGYGNHYLINTLDSPSSYPAYAIGIYGVVKLAAAPPGGWLLERVRPASVICLSGFCSAGGLAEVIVSGSASGYLAGVALLSLGTLLAWLQVFHLVGDRHVPSERGGAMASMGLVSVAATASGLALAALFGEMTHWRFPFVLGAGLALAATAILLLVRSLPGAAGAPLALHERERGEAPWRKWSVAAGVVFGHFALVTSLVAAAAPFVLRTLDLSLLQAGIAIAPGGLAGAGAMLVFGRHSKAGQRLPLATALYAVAAISLGGLALVTNQALFALATIPLAMSLGGLTPLVNASLIDASRAGDQPAVALGYLFFAEGLGNIAGPLLVGVVVALATERAGVAATAILALAVALLTGAAAREVDL